MARTSFDLLRLLAAVTVLIGHSQSVVTGNDQGNALLRLTGGQLHSGRAAVLVFFVLSGYLVAGSWLRRPTWQAFVLARALRIYPALIAVVLATVFVLGPLVSHDPGYWVNPDTYAYLGQIGLFFSPAGTLPGVFEEQSSRTVNTNLWTLPLEISCYGALLLLGILGGLTRRVMAVSTAALMVTHALALHFRVSAQIPHWWLLEFGPYFTAGATLFLWRDALPWRASLAWLCAAGVVISMPLGGLPLTLPVLGAYALLYAAQRPWGGWWPRHTDYSYGVYLIGTPLIHLVLEVAPTLPWALNALLALLGTLGLAAASWHGLERPALRWKEAEVFRYRPPLRRTRSG